jgi:hypothetical protein
VPPLHVVVVSGAISCATAVRDMTTIFRQMGGSPSGSSAGIKVGGWTCTGPQTPADAQIGIIMKCGQGGIHIRAQEFGS